MKTITEFIRERLLNGITLNPVLSLSKLRKTEWSHRFERYQRNRLLMGAYRYGLFNDLQKVPYDRCRGISDRLKLYLDTGNKEYLVDIANLAMLEFEEGVRHTTYFKAQDDKGHISVKRIG